MNKGILALLLVFFSSTVFADQVATMTCTGSEVILEVKSPYLGENSKMAQELYILKAKDNNAEESQFTAYFLDDVKEAKLERIQNGVATTTLRFFGKNSVGGKFDLRIAPWVEESDDLFIRKTSTGTIDYNHGPLQGEGEQVSCVLE